MREIDRWATLQEGPAWNDTFFVKYVSIEEWEKLGKKHGQHQSLVSKVEMAREQ